MGKLSTFIDELRRRRVFRVAAFYGGIAFVIIQIIDGAFSYLHIPEWFGTAIIVLLLIGFPVAMILAWVFDITEGGIVRTKGRPADVQHKAQPLLGNKVLAMIALAAVVFGVWGQMGSRRDYPIKLAVLPFENYSEQAEEWFSDGITDNITTQLAKLSGLTVIGRTSVMQYKGTTKRLKDIGAELGVDVLLEGSVQKIGGKVRIVAQLIDARSEGHLWTDSYDREVKDDEIFSLQSDIARNIAEALVGKLSQDESISLSKAPTANRDAYNLYLKGLYYWNKRTGDDALVARDYFEQAITADPDYADAYVGLALCYDILHQYAGLPPAESYPKAREAALRALEIDPRNAGAYTALAYVHEKYDYDWEKAEAAYLAALRLDPDHPTAHQWYGEVLSVLGRKEDSIHHLKLAATLDPLSKVILITLGYHQITWGHSNEGLSVLLEGERLFGFDVLSGGWAESGYHQLGQYEESYRFLQKIAITEYPDSLRYLAAEGETVHATQGYDAYYRWQTDVARNFDYYWQWIVFIKDGTTLPGPEWVESQKAAYSDWFFTRLSEGIDSRDVGAWYTMAAPLIRPVFGDDPRYLALKKKMNLP